ncbi:MAG TPA: nuclear transport factor 2 family protein [Bryobacteraceae bacterium]|nr:nuclear transport factor 2 family protein [Bryobacteraceae bacterium]
MPDDWLARLLGSLDNLDADLVASQFQDDARLCYGNTPFAAGRRAIRKAFVRAFAELDSLHYQCVATWASESVAVLEGDLSYEALPFRAGTLPMTVVLRFCSNRICDCQVFTYSPFFGHL